MLERFLLAQVLNLLKTLIKNPAKAKKLKGILLDIRDAINDLY